MITYAQLLLILAPILLAMFAYIIRIERTLVRISIELKNLKEKVK